MIVALVDNGSLEPAAHRNLRAVAAALSASTGLTVHGVSWKHSDRLVPAELDDTPAWTITPFVRSLVALGQREFVFVPFFISAQGAIGSALRADLEKLQRELAPTTFEFSFTGGLAESGAIPEIVVARVRAALTSDRTRLATPPPVVVVDHGGPSAASAKVRDAITAEIRAKLGADVASVTAASMEGVHPPLLSDVLNSPAFSGRAAIVAPLFLSPGRHAGPVGDIAQICRASPARCVITELVGTHPLAVDALAQALRASLSTLHAHPFFA